MWYIIIISALIIILISMGFSCIWEKRENEFKEVLEKEHKSYQSFVDNSKCKKSVTFNLDNNKFIQPFQEETKNQVKEEDSSHPFV